MSFIEEYPLLTWAFGGIGITVTGLIIKGLISIYFPKNIEERPLQTTNTATANGNNVSVNVYNSREDLGKNPKPLSVESEDSMGTQDTYEIKKHTTKILFIDDEVKFKVVKILQNAGWMHTKLIKDAKSLDQTEIYEAHIIFVDVQGVGVELNFKEEGLGLASALKKKYPLKKIIIYSAEQTGDRFHQALREADDFLPKDADPYQFQSVVESFA